MNTMKDARVMVAKKPNKMMKTPMESPTRLAHSKMSSMPLTLANSVL